MERFRVADGFYGFHGFQGVFDDFSLEWCEEAQSSLVVDAVNRAMQPQVSGRGLSYVGFSDSIRI